ncbi:hypothetical protein AVEN_169025-1 [Araneus ventricosus]|uniref:Uncharacterized protein n=1 Tax=Araneus ventricosus TaxID=182803 RepID=A0A4Y1ZRK5_ARAVE|nr:hypothetical protein AVEN_169025-1 [Araneus ventricosus]
MINQTCTDLNLTCSLCNITVDLKRSPSKRRYPKCTLFSLHFTVKLNRKLAELYLIHPEKSSTLSAASQHKNNRNRSTCHIVRTIAVTGVVEIRYLQRAERRHWEDGAPQKHLQVLDR